MTIDTEVLKKSVTRDDYEDDPRNTPLYFIFPQSIGTRTYTELLPWWSRDRDYQLRNTVHREAMWASAIYKAITKQASLGWDIDDASDSKVRAKRAQSLYLHANLGKGWVSFLFRHLRDFLLTDNGAFVEVVRASSARGSRIMGLVPLDSCRCLRTADPTQPVIYRNREGREHIMRDHQVLMFADMEDSSETYNGVGMCAASRAYPTISKLSAMEQYVFEKMSGDGATELSFVNGISQKSLESALTTADATQKSKGAAYYKGKIIIPIMTDKPPEVANIPLKNVPDGFDAEQERDNGYLIYANAIGVAVQDIQPLSGQGLGTGTQTVILDEAAEGQGLASWRKQWEQMNNEFVLPESTTFIFSTNDIRDQKAKAEVAKIRADERAVRIASGEIGVEEARQLALDAGDLTPEMQPDTTAAGTLSDVEKPLEDAEDASLPDKDMGEGTEAETEEVATKADDDLDSLIGDNWRVAVALAKEMVRW